MSNLFNNPMITAAKKAMSKKDLEKYEKLGNSMYKDINFEECSLQTQNPSVFKESLLHIEVMLKSGLHPSMLNNDEKNVMKEMKGEEWYKKYGYIKEDLESIVTLKFE